MMDIDEAKEEYVLVGMVNNDVVDNAIANIYDDFESRTCENCKFIEVCALCLLVVKDGEFSDFGCSEFKRKSD